MNRYPKNWPKIALQIKKQVEWKCGKCGQQCLKPCDNKKGLTKSELAKLRLDVHHANYQPEDNRPQNLIPLCSSCHLSYHRGKRGNVVIGQLSLFPDF